LFRNAKIEYTIRWRETFGIRKTFADEGCVLISEPIFGYRIYDPLRTIIRIPDELRIPFVNIFLIDNQYDEYVYITEDAKKFFPSKPLPFECFQHLVGVPFGHLTLRGLNPDDTQRHLDESLGND
jgi:hypothetical protein